MCAYDALNGVPMCGSPQLETAFLRTEGGMGYANGSYIQGDCGAVDFIYSAHHYADNDTQAAAIALNAGTDIDCGDTFTGSLADAIAAGMTTEATLDASLTRTFTLHFAAGRFDPVAQQPYAQIPMSVVDSPAHQALALDAALQGMVLLRNDGRLLPLPAGKRIAVIGPLVNATEDLMGNYFESRCPGADDGYDCVPTVLAAVTAANVGGTVTSAQGCDIVNASVSDIPAAVALAQAADVVILTIGMNGQARHGRGLGGGGGARERRMAAVSVERRCAARALIAPTSACRVCS
jgi:beta-glucosidase-like glycosyl hydrolase